MGLSLLLLKPLRPDILGGRQKSKPRADPSGDSVKDIDTRGNVLDQPVKALNQPLSGISTASGDLPVPGLVDGTQIQHLQFTWAIRQSKAVATIPH